MNKTFLCALIVFLIGCSTEEYVPSSGGIPGIAYEGERVVVAKKYPWIRWQQGRDTAGNSFVDKALLSGDAYIEESEFQKALDSYSKVKRVGLSFFPEEALVQRIAGTALVLGQYKRSLSVLSDFYKREGEGISRIPPESGFILALSFHKKGDIAQAMAWFSDSLRKSEKDFYLNGVIKDSIREVLSQESEVSLKGLSDAWRDDSDISPIILQVLTHRSQRLGEVTLSQSMNNATPQQPDQYTSGVPQELSGDSVPLPPPTTTLTVGVMLPLGSQLQQLGTSINNGLMLAVEDAGLNQNIQFVVKDSTQDPTYAEQLAREFMDVNQAQLIVGPLVSEQSVTVAQLLRGRGVPAIVFSKASNFSPGNGVFRVGTTLDVQLRKIFEYLKTTQIKNIAVVYPKTPSGEEAASLFQSYAAHSGVTASVVLGYERNDEGALNAISEKVGRSAVQGVFFPDNLRTAAGFFTAIPEKVKTQITPIGLAMWDVESELRNSGFALDGAVYPSFFNTTLSQFSQKFNESYKLKFGKAPDVLSGLGYDAGVIFTNAFKRSSAQGVSLEQALYTVHDVEGTAGPMKVLPGGEIERDISVIQFKSGAFTKVY